LEAFFGISLPNLKNRANSGRFPSENPSLNIKSGNHLVFHAAGLSGSLQDIPPQFTFQIYFFTTNLE